MLSMKIFPAAFGASSRFTATKLMKSSFPTSRLAETCVQSCSAKTDVKLAYRNLASKRILYKVKYRNPSLKANSTVGLRCSDFPGKNSLLQGSFAGRLIISIDIYAAGCLLGILRYPGKAYMDNSSGQVEIRVCRLLSEFSNDIQIF